MDRSKILHDIRPEVTHHSVGDDLNSAEGFQNHVLRPVLKLQNDWILTLVTDYLVRRHKVNLQKIDPADLSKKVKALISGNQKLRSILLGAIIGLMTEEELKTYLTMETELKKRIFTMMHQRIMDNFERNGQRKQTGIPVF